MRFSVKLSRAALAAAPVLLLATAAAAQSISVADLKLDGVTDPVKIEARLDKVSGSFCRKQQVTTGTKMSRKSECQAEVKAMLRARLPEPQRVALGLTDARTGG